MSTFAWLARCAAMTGRLLSGRTAETFDTHQRLRRAARRSLGARLPPHLLKDVGADDG